MSIRVVSWSFAVSLSLGLAAGCGEHPCTLGKEPQFCSANPEEFDNPFCGEVCGVCDYDREQRMQAACNAKCREVVGIPEHTCEELDPLIEIEYRECVRRSDYPGCGGAQPNSSA